MSPDLFFSETKYLKMGPKTMSPSYSFLANSSKQTTAPSIPRPSTPETVTPKPDTHRLPIFRNTCIDADAIDAIRSDTYQQQPTQSPVDQRENKMHCRKGTT